MPIRAIAIALLAASCAWAQATTSSGEIASITQSKSAITKASTPKQSEPETKAEARARENEARAKKALALRLLKRSHGGNQELSLEDRVSVLSEQVRTAGRLNPKLARTWADELFALANQLPSQMTTGAQEKAVSALAASDPDHAL
ncbi:MAG TPA: hypothetical protein VEG30_04765 [Terriglobales bacterium]|nr:hypothetical protein [Terriglobales bacterium]